MNGRRTGLADPERLICLARVVVPTSTIELIPIEEPGLDNEGKMEFEPDCVGDNAVPGDPGWLRVTSQQSRHHNTPKETSPLAAESSFFPHPGPLTSSRAFQDALTRLLCSLPPQTRQGACHLVAEGPGTMPRSMGETDTWQPGQTVTEPNRGAAGMREPAPAGDGIELID